MPTFSRCPRATSITVRGHHTTLHKAAGAYPASEFMSLVGVLASLAGRLRFRRLLRELSDDPRSRRAPRIVGVA